MFIVLAAISLLPSYTNVNYLLDNHYVLRIPGKGSESYIDRSSEYHNAKEASKYGFNPVEIYFFNPSTGYQLTGFVPSEPLKWDDFHDSAWMQALATLLKKLHTSPADFQNETDVFKRLNAFGKTLPAAGKELRREIDTLSPLLYHPSFPKAPCHNDPIPDNLLKIGGKLYLIDWENAGRNHPAWDLAHLSCLMQYSEEEDRLLTRSYGSNDPELLYSCVVLFKAVSEFWIASWAFSQGEKFLPYAEAHLQRCQNQVQSERYKRAKEYVYQNIRCKT